MRTRAFALVAAAFACSGCSERTTADIARRTSESVVTVLAHGPEGDTLGLGSGFFVRGTGELVTNYHVLDGASSASIVFASGRSRRVSGVLAADSLLDLALLKVSGTGYPALSLRPDLPSAGERVVAIGSPLGLSNTVSEGIVSAVRTIDGRRLVQITAAISPGSSGGAVFDDNGRVFAVSTLYLEGGQGLNFAVPVAHVLPWLSSSSAPRAIAEVFAPIVPSNATSLPASSPRAARTWAYRVTEHLRREGMDDVRSSGLLVVGETVGLLDLPSTGLTAHVSDFSSSESGSVQLEAASIRWVGAAHPSGGFRATATYVDADGVRTTSTLSAELEPLGFGGRAFTSPISLSLSSSLCSDCHPDPWIGEMAVVASRDSIWIHVRAVAETAPRLLGISLAQAGSIVFSGPFLSERFVLSHSSSRGSVETHWRLTGSLVAGKLQAIWEREFPGAFTERGPLIALSP